VKSTAPTIKWSTKRVIDTVSGYTSVLDIGCGTGNTISRVRALRRYGIDGCAAAISVARQKCNDVIFEIFDLKSLEQFWKHGHVDCVIGLDIVEHFFPKDAVRLIKACEAIATKHLIFFIPVGKHVQIRDDRGFGNHYYQTHRSTWYPHDMAGLGYEVFHYPDWHKNPGPGKEKGAMWCQKIL
jgi:SAM-dependent methyltransferase